MLNCNNSFASGDFSTDVEVCGKVMICMQDDSGSAYFGKFGLGTFAIGSSPNNYTQDYNNANPYEPSGSQFQCFLIDYTPDPNSNSTTDSITLQETDVNDNPVGSPCTFTFNIPTPCGGAGNQPVCPTPTPSITYDLNNPSGNLVVDIVNDFGFASDCVLTFANEASATISIAPNGTLMTMTQAGLTAAGVGNYTINYGVECGANGVDGFINCAFTLNIVNNTTTLFCPSPAPIFNYDKSTQTTDLALSPSDMGFSNACTFLSVTSSSVTTTINANGSLILVDATSLASYNPSQHAMVYAIDCNGESITCTFSVVITDGADPCINCNSIQVDVNNVPSLLGQSVNVACGSGPINLAFNIPNPNGESLDYFFPGNSAGAFNFVSSDAVINGFQKQYWTFTPKTSGCAESVDVVLTWLATGNQGGCPVCSIFTIFVGDCADCGGGGGCTSIATCSGGTVPVTADANFTLTATGCDCPGCQVVWINSATNPATITLTNSVGNTVTNTFPANVPQGVYSFEPTCCGCTN